MKQKRKRNGRSKQEKYKGSVIQRTKKKEKRTEDSIKIQKKTRQKYNYILPETPNTPPLHYQEVVESRAETMRRLGRKKRQSERLQNYLKIRGFTFQLEKACEQIKMPQAEEKMQKSRRGDQENRRKEGVDLTSEHS